MRDKIKNLFIFIRLNAGLLKKMAYYVGIPCLVFLFAVVFIVKYGGISSYTIDTYTSDGAVRLSIKPNIANIITGALFFVVLPVVVSLLAISRKSMSFKAAALLVNFIAIVVMTVSLNPTGNVGCGMSRSGSRGAGGGADDTAWGGNPASDCQVASCDSCATDDPCLALCKACANDATGSNCDAFDACVNETTTDGGNALSLPSSFPECAASSSLADKIKSMSIPPTKEDLLEIRQLSSDLGVCPPGTSEIDAALQSACSSLEGEMNDLRKSTHFFPVTVGEIAGDLDIKNSQKGGVEGDVYSIPPFKFFFPVLEDSGSIYFDNYTEVTLKDHNSTGSKTINVVDASVANNSSGNSTTVKSSGYVLTSVSDGSGLVDGQMVAVCASEAPTGVKMSIADNGLAYAVAVYKPWVRTSGSGGSIPTGATDSYFGKLAAQNFINASDIASSKYMNFDIVKSLDTAPEFYVPFGVGWCNVLTQMPISKVGAAVNTYQPDQMMQDDMTQSDRANYAAPATFDPSTWLEAGAYFGNERSMLYPACLSYKEEKSTDVGLTWKQTDLVSTCWNCRDKVKAGNFSMCKALADHKDSSGGGTADFEYTTQLSNLGGKSDKDDYMFIVVDDDGCTEGSGVNIKGTTIGGAKASGNYVLGAMAFDMDSVDVLTDQSGGCKMSKFDLYKRSISAIDYRDPRISFLEYVSWVNMLAKKKSGDDLGTAQTLIVTDYFKKAQLLQSGLSEKISAYKFFNYLSPDTAANSATSLSSAHSHMQMNFTGQLVPVGVVPIDGTAKAKQNTADVSGGIIDFSTSDFDCLRKVANYLKAQPGFDSFGTGSYATGLDVAFGSDSTQTTKDNVGGEGLVLTGLFVASKLDASLSKTAADATLNVKASPGCFVGQTQAGFRKVVKAADPFTSCRSTFGKDGSKLSSSTATSLNANLVNNLKCD